MFEIWFSRGCSENHLKGKAIFWCLKTATNGSSFLNLQKKFYPANVATKNAIGSKKNTDSL